MLTSLPCISITVSTAPIPLFILFRLRALLVPSFPFPPRFTPSPKQAPARRRRHARLRIVPRRAAPSSRTR